MIMVSITLLFIQKYAFVRKIKNTALRRRLAASKQREAIKTAITQHSMPLLESICLKKSPRNPEALSIPNGCGNLVDNSSKIK
jgi:hypothetical protein